MTNHDLTHCTSPPVLLTNPVLGILSFHSEKATLKTGLYLNRKLIHTLWSELPEYMFHISVICHTFCLWNPPPVSMYSMCTSLWQVQAQEPSSLAHAALTAASCSGGHSSISSVSEVVSCLTGRCLMLACLKAETQGRQSTTHISYTHAIMEACTGRCLLLQLILAVSNFGKPIRGYGVFQGVANAKLLCRASLSSWQIILSG